MDFGQALVALKNGEKVARKGWNGKGMFIYLVNEQKIPNDMLRNEADKHINGQYKTESSRRGRRTTINGHIDMKAADGSIVVGWLASQTDLLAEDWEIVA